MKKLSCEITDDQMQFLIEVAESEKISVSAVIRTAIKLLDNELPKVSHYKPFPGQNWPMIANSHNAQNNCV